MTMYLPLRPDGTPPEGAAPDSPRYERVLTTEVPSGLRLPLGVAGAAIVAAGAVMVHLGIPWGILGWIAGGAAVVAAATGGMRGFEWRTAPHGAWVEATPEHAEETAHARSRSQSRTYRAGAGILGACFTFFLLLETVSPTGGTRDWKILLLLAVLAVVLSVIAITGRLPLTDDVEAPLPPRFHEFADPTLPLPPEAFAAPAVLRERAAEVVESRPASSERPARDGD
ncbi:MAG: hypothetical protein JO306_07935 [Gemmatimonadetes bacterium]|nr:hypothetical protein [Gemmatimonadota bacterium]